MMGARFTRRLRGWSLVLPLFVAVATVTTLAVAVFASGSEGLIDRTRELPSGSAATGMMFMPFISRTPGPPQLQLVPFAVGFENKTIMDISHAGDERLFISTREGKVWIVLPNGAILPEPYLDIGEDGADLPIEWANFEQGLLGLTFHPDYPDTPYFYFMYTSPSHLHVVRGEVDPNKPNRADHGSLKDLFNIKKPPASGEDSPVHNGGDLAFGPDGYLYIPIGDGGPDPLDLVYGVPGDPNNHSQRRDILFGSILRINSDPNGGLPADCGQNGLYSIPADNPWLNDYGCDELWAKGLRNPWRMTIDKLTGDFYIADVGEWLWEEVNYLPAGSPGGANFGWHCWEGTTDYVKEHPEYPELAATCPPGQVYNFPVHQYDHSLGECSIIGGKVYRGSKYPSLYGYYFFGDWCTGRIWTMIREGGVWEVAPAGELPVSYSTFGEDIHGELYAGEYLNGTLYKIIVK
jgi:glucose/arabinose dehydrogenase